MTWSDFYLLCFFLGFIFSLVSMISGHVHLDFHRIAARPGHQARPVPGNREEATGAGGQGL